MCVCVTIVIHGLVVRVYKRKGVLEETWSAVTSEECLHVKVSLTQQIRRYVLFSLFCFKFDALAFISYWIH